MRWDSDNVEAMLALSALDHSQQWAAYWKLQCAAYGPNIRAREVTSRRSGCEQTVTRWPRYAGIGQIPSKQSQFGDLICRVGVIDRGFKKPEF